MKTPKIAATRAGLIGDPGRVIGGPAGVEEAAAAMEAAIRRGAERLRELQRQIVAPAAGAGLVELRVEEVTDLVEIRVLEGQITSG